MSFKHNVFDCVVLLNKDVMISTVLKERDILKVEAAGFRVVVAGQVEPLSRKDVEKAEALRSHWFWKRFF